MTLLCHPLILSGQMPIHSFPALRQDLAKIKCLSHPFACEQAGGPPAWQVRSWLAFGSWKVLQPRKLTVLPSARWGFPKLQSRQMKSDLCLPARRLPNPELQSRREPRSKAQQSLQWPEYVKCCCFEGFLVQQTSNICHHLPKCRVRRGAINALAGGYMSCC